MICLGCRGALGHDSRDPLRPPQGGRGLARIARPLSPLSSHSLHKRSDHGEGSLALGEGLGEEAIAVRPLGLDHEGDAASGDFELRREGTVGVDDCVGGADDDQCPRIGREGTQRGTPVGRNQSA